MITDNSKVNINLIKENKALKTELEKQISKMVYIVTYNDDYGRPIFDSCFGSEEKAKEYIKNLDYTRLDYEIKEQEL